MSFIYEKIDGGYREVSRKIKDEKTSSMYGGNDGS